MRIFESVPASPEEVEVFASELKSSHLRCRTWGHDPLPYDVSYVRDVNHHPTAVAEARMRCSHRCGVQWVMLLDGDFQVLTRNLDYSGAPGYLSENGRIDPTGKNRIRKEFFVRSFTTVEEAVKAETLTTSVAKKTAKKGA